MPALLLKVTILQQNWGLVPVFWLLQMMLIARETTNEMMISATIASSIMRLARCDRGLEALASFLLVDLISTAPIFRNIRQHRSNVVTSPAPSPVAPPPHWRSSQSPRSGCL